MAELKLTLDRGNIETILKVFIAARHNLNDHNLKVDWIYSIPEKPYKNAGIAYFPPQPQVDKVEVIAVPKGKEELYEDQNRNEQDGTGKTLGSTAG